MKKSKLLYFMLIFPLFCFAQTLQISGVITDVNNGPIPGVNVILQNSSIGSLTDFDGKFVIEASKGDVLIFSFIGMKTQSITVGDKSTINVVMEEDASELEEVLVVGYATQKKINITGAVAAIQSKDLVKVPVANATNLIGGRLAGVITKQESGAPGDDSSSINIRGFGQPLIIVDGIARGFNDINAEEIESMTVLKDASAAIYGARAGNGVVLITTKRGKVSKTVLQYNSSYSFQQVTDYPGFVNSGQYSELYREAEINDGISVLSYTEEDIANFYSGADGYANGDWWGATVRDWSPLQKHSLSLRGGKEGIRFYGFMGYTGQEGMYKSGDNKMDRYNLRSNIDVDINKNLTFSVDLAGVIQDVSSPVDDAKTVFTHIFNALPVFPTSLPDASLVPYSGKGPQNPAAITSRDIAGYNDTFNQKISSSLKLNYKVPFVEGLQLTGRFDYYGKTGNDKKWLKSYDLYSYDAVTDVYSKSASQEIISLKEDFSRQRILTGQFSIDYKRTFNTDHEVKGLLIYEAIDTKGNNFWASRQEFITPAIEQLFASGIENQNLSGKAYEDGRVGYIGRVNYGYKGKYLLEATLRVDGSNRFNEENRWGYFPSISAGWRISKESFMENDWLDNLKIRASYSQAGKDDTGKYQFLTGYQFGQNYIINDELVKGINSMGVPNRDITWENMTTYNAGLDFSGWNKKLYADFDVFYRLRDGILATRDRSLPSTVGAILAQENLNSLSNRGFELSLGHKNSIGDFNYSVTGMVSWARSKWESFNEPDYTDPDDIRINQKTGKWTNLSYGYKSLGFFQTQEEIDAWPLDQDLNGNSSILPGDLKYEDLNGDNVLDWRDKDVIGKNGLAEVMYGLNVDINYKGFDFGLLLQGSAEHYVDIQERSVFSSSFPKPFTYMFEDRWTPGVEDALYPRASLSTSQNNIKDSDFWHKSAAYLRLKSINLGYTFPSEMMQKGGFSALRLYISGENLLTFSNLTKYGLDPESPYNNGSRYYPQMKTISCGLSLTF